MAQKATSSVDTFLVSLFSVQSGLFSPVSYPVYVRACFLLCSLQHTLQRNCAVTLVCQYVWILQHAAVREDSVAGRFNRETDLAGINSSGAPAHTASGPAGHSINLSW